MLSDLRAIVIEHQLLRALPMMAQHQTALKESRRETSGQSLLTQFSTVMNDAHLQALCTELRLP
jgi:hypothetical protein